MASLTFSKIIFAILLVGILFTGFVKFGSEITDNTNLDNGTAVYLSSINESIQNIESLSLNETQVDIGEEDSFSKQYKEAKLYANTASGLLSTAGDTPELLVNTLDVEQEENNWLIDYILLAIKIMLFIVVLYMLFGRKF